MSEWADVTSYGRNNKDREPLSWKIKSGNVVISITKGHIYYKGQWAMHCPNLCIDTKPLKAESLEDAKREALAVAKNVAANTVALIEKIEPKD